MGGSTATYVDSQWYDKPSFVFIFFSRDSDFMMVKCHSEFSPYHGTVSGNVYIAPFCFIYDIGLFCNAFLSALVPLLPNYLCVITYPSLSCGFADPCLIRTRTIQLLSNLFHLWLHIPALSSDRFLISVTHTTCSHFAHQLFVRTKRIKGKTRNPSHENISLFQMSFGFPSNTVSLP